VIYLVFIDANNAQIRKVDKLTGVISTVAGNGIYGPSNGDGGLATEAQIDVLRGFAIDESNNLYISDLNGSSIRKVSSVTGIINRFAGNGISGFSGDGGQAINAQFAFPEGMVFDKSGNLFIAELGNNRIRKIDITGIISTIAGSGILGNTGDGGSALNANMRPDEVSIDSAGNLFLSSSAFSVIRKINAQTNQITTVAGNNISGESGIGGLAVLAQIQYAYGVKFDKKGNLFFADNYNNKIKKVDNSSGILTTIAGTNIAGYSGDGGPANLATLNSPSGTEFDDQGNLYISDFYNNVIRKITFPRTSLTGSDLLKSFNACFPNPSLTQSFAVSAVGLIDNLSITAPTGFEISLNTSSGFASSLSLSPISGNVTNTTIYVRLSASDAVGTYPGNITLSAPNMTTDLIALAGNVFTKPATPIITSSLSNSFESDDIIKLKSNIVSGNQWYLNSVAITNASNQTYTAVSSGAYTTVITDINHCVSDISNVINIKYEPKGKGGNVKDNLAKLIPNPASSNVTVKFDYTTTSTLTIQLINGAGQVLKQVQTNSQTVNISLAGIISGNYFIKIIGLGTNQMQQLIVRK